MRGIAPVQYALAAVLFVLAAFVAYKSYAAWKFYSNVELALEHYNSASYGPAHKALSSVASHRPDDPRVAAFEAHLLSLQGYHEKAVSQLESSAAIQEGIVKLALASEMLFTVETSEADLTEEIALLEGAVDFYEYPDPFVALGGAHLRAGDMEKAGANLETAGHEAGRLSFDGLIALRINVGVLSIKLRKYEWAAGSFKEVIELLPERKELPLAGGRKQARESAERGLALACLRWLEAAELEERKTAIKYVANFLDERQATGSRPKVRWELGKRRYLLFNALGVAQGRLKLYDRAKKSFSQALTEARYAPREKREHVKQAIALNRAIFAAAQLEKTPPPETSRKTEFSKVAKLLADAAGGRLLTKKQRYAAYNLSAKFYHEAGIKRTTENVLKGAIELMPDEPAAIVNLAVHYDRLDRKAEAIELYEKALKLEKLKRRVEVEKRLRKLKG